MKIISSSIHQCPECLRTKTYTPEQILFVVSGTKELIRCAACGWVIDAVRDLLPDEVEIPSALERLVEVLVFQKGLGICEADNDGLDPVNGKAISRTNSLSFQHKDLLILGSLSWCEVSQVRQFTHWKMDFADFHTYVPLVGAMVEEFNREEFLVSEYPGKGGRGLRDAAIKYCRYLEAPIPAQSPSRWEWIAERQGTQSRAGKTENGVLRVRSHLTWDLGYRRLPDGSVEEVAS